MPENSDGSRDSPPSRFLDVVELFKKVFDQFHGTTLPSHVGLQNLLETTHGVVESRVVPTVRIMLDSAEYAGLFAASGDQTRMVQPLTTLEDNTRQGPLPTDATDGRVQNGGRNDRGGVGGDGGDYGTSDPSILGLLR